MRGTRAVTAVLEAGSYCGKVLKSYLLDFPLRLQVNHITNYFKQNQAKELSCKNCLQTYA